MKVITLDTAQISDEESFHSAFKTRLGFPDFYGANMDAWIDCMGCLDDPESGMTGFTIERGDFLVIHVENASAFSRLCPELWLSFLECAAIVNGRRVSRGLPPLLAVSSYP